MAVNGKSKGNSYERDISNKLSERFEKHTGIEKSFRRNIDSGSFFGAKNFYRTKTHDLDNACFGDIMTPKDFKYTIECKNYKTAPTLSLIMKGKIKQWDEWIKQSEHDAENANKKPLLIMKYNGVNSMIVTKECLKSFNVNPYVLYGEYKIYLLDEFLTIPDSFFFE